jgi:hypothetical protein
MLAILKNACQAFMAQEQLFWILAGMTDVSCETGSNRRYQRAIETFRSAGISGVMIDRLMQGVNGNLTAVIESQCPAIVPVAANRKRGRVRPDIWFGEKSSANETIAEVKALHDWTTLAFYGHKAGHGVADDADKLHTIRLEPFKGHLLQVVFFLQLPNYSYCSGHSYGEWHDCRESALIVHGIDAQYRQLRAHLTKEPVWPRNGPLRVPLGVPDKSICHCIEQWMTEVFQPDDPGWKFVAAEQLVDAAIACAIWEY